VASFPPKGRSAVAESFRLKIAHPLFHPLMPSLPLYLPEVLSLDASHHVTAAGGYEWWYFDAEDRATDTQIVAIFLDGFVFHPEYLRRYSAYHRAPTRNSPPVASDYPCAYFVIYRAGKVLAQFMTQYPAGSFQANTDSPRVAIGPNSMRCDESGSYQLHLEGSPWHLTWQGPRRPEHARLSADFEFCPRLSHAPHEREFLSRGMTGADHRWVIAAPLCHVAGTIRFIPSASQAEEIITFHGRGYHDHNFGSGPLGPGLRRWMWGRILLESRAFTFHFAEPRDRLRAPETHLIDATQDQFLERTDQHWEYRIDRRGGTGLGYPSTVRYGDRITLTNPRVIDSTPFYLRLMYQAAVHGEPVATAFCEVAYPHRLRWPVLGRMIEMSIHREESGA
jgi:carotenoid 1,2-hydratase